MLSPLNPIMAIYVKNASAIVPRRLMHPVDQNNNGSYLLLYRSTLIFRLTGYGSLQ